MRPCTGASYCAVLKKRRRGHVAGTGAASPTTSQTMPPWPSSRSTCQMWSLSTHPLSRILDITAPSIMAALLGEGSSACRAALIAHASEGWGDHVPAGGRSRRLSCMQRRFRRWYISTATLLLCWTLRSCLTTPPIRRVATCSGQISCAGLRAYGVGCACPKRIEGTERRSPGSSS